MGILFRQSWRTFMVFFSSCRDFIPTVRIMYFKFTMKFSRLIKKSSLSDVAKQNWKAWQVLFKVVQLKVHTQIAFSLSHSDAVDIWWLWSIKCLPDILCSVGVLYFFTFILYHIKILLSTLCRKRLFNFQCGWTWKNFFDDFRRLWNLAFLPVLSC